MPAKHKWQHKQNIVLITSTITNFTHSCPNIVTDFHSKSIIWGRILKTYCLNLQVTNFKIKHASKEFQVISRRWSFKPKAVQNLRTEKAENLAPLYISLNELIV